MLHKGHKALLLKALRIAGKNGSVFIGLTADEFTQNKANVLSFQERKKAIEHFIAENNALHQVEIQPLYDAYGPSIEGDFDAIVVSPETQSTAHEINQRRKSLKKKQLQIIVVPFILADDKKPISSTRIRNKEIDGQGTVLRKE